MCILTSLLITPLAYIVLVYFFFCRATMVEKHSSAVNFLNRFKAAIGHHYPGDENDGDEKANGYALVDAWALRFGQVICLLKADKIIVLVSYHSGYSQIYRPLLNP